MFGFYSIFLILSEESQLLDTIGNGNTLSSCQSSRCLSCEHFLWQGARSIEPPHPQRVYFIEGSVPAHQKLKSINSFSVYLLPQEGEASESQDWSIGMQHLMGIHPSVNHKSILYPCKPKNTAYNQSVIHKQYPLLLRGAVCVCVCVREVNVCYSDLMKTRSTLDSWCVLCLYEILAWNFQIGKKKSTQQLKNTFMVKLFWFRFS